MSGRRGGAAVPLITLIVSFGLVLALGGWLGEPKSDNSAPTGPPASVHLQLQDLRDTDRKLEPFPGLTLTVSRPSATNGTTPSGVATETVEICMIPSNGWSPALKAERDQWMPDGKNGFCRQVSRTQGKIDFVDIWLERS